MVSPGARRLYKQLLWVGRTYPAGWDSIREKVKAPFFQNRDVTDPEQLQKLYDRGYFVVKELDALRFLHKYRAMKNRYYKDTPDAGGAAEPPAR